MSLDNTTTQSSTLLTRPRRAPEGHEGYLAAMIKNRVHARIRLTDGQTLLGTVTAFDKFTISILAHDASFPETFFKHSVRSFTRDC